MRCTPVLQHKSIPAPSCRQASCITKRQQRPVSEGPAFAALQSTSSRCTETYNGCCTRVLTLDSCAAVRRRASCVTWRRSLTAASRRQTSCWSCTRQSGGKVWTLCSRSSSTKQPAWWHHRGRLLLGCKGVGKVWVCAVLGFECLSIGRFQCHGAHCEGSCGSAVCPLRLMV